MRNETWRLPGVDANVKGGRSAKVAGRRARGGGGSGDGNGDDELGGARGRRDRRDTFTLQNAVLDGGFRAHDLMARLALQTGTAPSSYYASKPAVPGTDTTGASTPELWRHLQRASVGWEATHDLLLEAGLFLTSFGLEGLAVKDTWNWSRSNLSVHLPNYVTGLKSTLHASKRVDLVSGVVNGWNRVVDDNDEKMLFMSLVFKVEKSFTASASYYGGVEREGGAPEGRAWRHAT